jgi:hypothetical protein
LTNDPGKLRDAVGNELLYPGRSHPLTRRAIAAVRTGRVSSAKADTLSLLVTYTVEVGSMLRDVFALRVFPDGSIKQQPNFLSLPEHPAEDRWNTQFAKWAPDAIKTAGPAAAAIAEKIASTYITAHQERIDRDTVLATVWLQRRTNELCGPTTPRTGDLFDNEPPSSNSLAPEYRLPILIADPTAPTSKRREATDVLARFNAMTNRPPIPPSSLRMLGLLMLVP